MNYAAAGRIFKRCILGNIFFLSVKAAGKTNLVTFYTYVSQLTFVNAASLNNPIFISCKHFCLSPTIQSPATLSLFSPYIYAPF